MSHTSKVNQLTVLTEDFGERSIILVPYIFVFDNCCPENTQKNSRDEYIGRAWRVTHIYCPDSLNIILEEGTGPCKFAVLNLCQWECMGSITRTSQTDMKCTLLLMRSMRVRVLTLLYVDGQPNSELLNNMELFM